MSWMNDADIMREQERQQLEHESWLRYYEDHEFTPKPNTGTTSKPKVTS